MWYIRQMIHPQYILLDNLYAIAGELRALNKTLPVARKLEVCADAFLKAIIHKKPLPKLSFSDLKLSLPRHREMLDKACKALSEPPVVLTPEARTMILATFGHRLPEFGGADAFV